ncbi:MAG TPA: PPOX class F420-dependent oxidoreductase [Dehalococcoidia bacterium]|nr:PPOX class F420-dependent oxidoreductase [Dehalococcoidia bacterium]
MTDLTPEQIAFLKEPNLGHVCTLMKDGQPQSTPVWIDWDGSYLVFNTAEGRQKPRNIARDPRVAVSVVDRNNGQRYLEIRGRVVEVVREGAREHLGMLARKYAGPSARNPASSDEVRLIMRIEPDHVTSLNF